MVKNAEYNELSKNYIYVLEEKEILQQKLNVLEISIKKVLAERDQLELSSQNQSTELRKLNEFSSSIFYKAYKLWRKLKKIA